MFAYSDQTIRVPKKEVARVRVLPQQFAPLRTRRWPYALMIGVLAVAACATTVKMAQRAERSAQAEEVLHLLGR